MIYEALKKLGQIPADLKSREPLKVGGALTKSFLISIVLLAILPQHTLENGWQVRIWAFLLSPPNEIGDTLAGIAGVLAFLWIIVTVWLQSMELKEQRKELQATRVELKLTRETQQEQLIAFKAQGVIFLDEQKQRKEVTEREVLNERIILLSSKMNFFRNDTFIIAKAGKYFSGERVHFVSGSVPSGLKMGMLPEDKGLSPQDEILQASIFFEHLFDVLNEIQSSGGLVTRSDGKAYFREVLELFKEIAASQNRLGPADKYVVDRLRIRRSQRVMNDILELTIWEEGPNGAIP